MPLVWRDPPPRSRIFTADVLTQLRANPGRWALVREWTTHGGRTLSSIGRPPADIEMDWQYHNRGTQLYARARKKD